MVDINANNEFFGAMENAKGHIHSKPVLWEPRIRETRNYGINLLGPNLFSLDSLLFFYAFKGSAYKGIPPI